MTWQNGNPTGVQHPISVAGPEYQQPKCPTCPHLAHWGFCAVVGCGCRVEPPACVVCGHLEHGGKDCFAWGIRRPCFCGQNGITTREKFIQWAMSPEGNR